MRTAVAEKTKTNPEGRGRWPRDGATKAATGITVRLTDDERARYTTAAETAGLTLGQWIRSACEAQLKRSGKKVR